MQWMLEAGKESYVCHKERETTVKYPETEEHIRFHMWQQNW